MKKISLLIASAAIALSAAATMPYQFNYQGVCELKNADINVEFTIVDEEGQEVYNQQLTTKTNANGAFTAVVGDDDLGAINWDGKYTLKTTINNELKSEAPLNAVPYALYVPGLNELSEEVSGLSIKFSRFDPSTIFANLDAISNLVTSLSEDIYKEDGLADHVVALEELSEDITGMQESISIVEDDLRGLVQEFPGMKAQIEENKLSAETAIERVEFLGNYVTNEDEEGSVINQLAKLTEGLDYVSSDVQGIQEKMRGLATVEELEATTNLAQSLSEDLYKEDGIVDHIIALDELNLPSVVENLEMMTPVLQKMEEDIETLTQGLDYVSNDVQGIQEKMRGFASVEDLEATTNLAQSLSEDLYKEEGLVDHIIALEELDLPQVVENLDMMIPQLQKMEDDIDANTDAIADVKADVVALSKFQETFNDEILAPISDAITENADAIADVKANVVSLSKFQETFNDDILAPISDAITENADAIADVKANVVNLSKFQETFNDEYMVPISDELTAQDTKIKDLQNQIDALAETIQDLIEQLTEVLGGTPGGVEPLK